MQTTLPTMMKRGLVIVGMLAGLAVLFLAGGSYMAASQVTGDSEQLMQEAEAETDDPVLKIQRLDALLDRKEMLDSWATSGVPARLWLFFDLDETRGLITNRYVKAVDAFVVAPLRPLLEERLKKASGAKYAEDYNTLKLYLLATDGPRHGFEDWMVTRIVRQRARMLTDDPKTTRGLMLMMAKHALELVDAWPGFIQRDQNLISMVRDRLSRVGSSLRYYDQYVTVLEDLKLDETGPDTPENRIYPAVRFTDPIVKSEAIVRGPYTARGFKAVRAGLDDGLLRLEREHWVVPLTPEEKGAGPLVKRAYARVWQDYEAQFIKEWSDLFRGLKPAGEQAALLKHLATPPSPYKTLIDMLKREIENTDDKIKGELGSLAAFPIQAYVELIIPLSAALDAKQTPDLATAERKTRELLLKLNPLGQELMAPLLLQPLGAKP